MVPSLLLTPRFYHSLQHLQIDTVQLIDVQAAHTRFILTELFQRGGMGIRL